MIGVLKALGADNFAIRKIFLSFSVFLIGRGMLWGNIIGVALCFIQSQFHLFKLDPATYYVDRVPVEFNIWIYLLLNVCTLLVSVLMLVGPSFLVTRIHPAKSIRFEREDSLSAFSVYPVLILFSYNAKVFFPYD